MPARPAECNPELPPYLAAYTEPLLEAECELDPYFDGLRVCVARHDITPVSRRITALTRWLCEPLVVLETHCDWQVGPNRVTDCATYRLHGDGKIIRDKYGEETIALADPGYDDGEQARLVRYELQEHLAGLVAAELRDDALAPATQPTPLALLRLAHQFSPPIAYLARQRAEGYGGY